MPHLCCLWCDGNRVPISITLQKSFLIGRSRGVVFFLLNRSFLAALSIYKQHTGLPYLAHSPRGEYAGRNLINLISPRGGGIGPRVLWRRGATKPSDRLRTLDQARTLKAQQRSGQQNHIQQRQGAHDDQDNLRRSQRGGCTRRYDPGDPVDT
jgi:hypothetical protein